MTTPLTGAPEWAAAQASPWVEHNKAIRIFDAFAASAVIKDRGLSAPPGSCADGDRYLVAGGASGLWAGHSGEMAIAVGTNASNGWYFADVAHSGVILWIEDEEINTRYISGAWQDIPDSITRLSELLDVDLTGLADGFTLKWDLSNGVFYAAPDIGLIGSEAREVSASSYDLLAEDAGRYLRFTAVAAKSVTVRPDATHALPRNGEWHIRNVGAGDLTFIEGAGVDIIPPAEGTLLVPPGGTVTLKRVETNVLDLIGVTNSPISG